MVFLKQRPPVDNNQKAWTKTSIIVEIGVAVEVAM